MVKLFGFDIHVVFLADPIFLFIHIPAVLCRM